MVILSLTVLAIVLVVGSFVLSAVLTHLTRIFALRIGFISKPASSRFAQRIVPLGGGISIFASLAIVLLSAVAIVKFLAVPGHLDWLGESVTIHTSGFLSKIDRIIFILLHVLVLFLLLFHKP